MESVPMLEIVQTPLARRMWRISKFFRIPLNDQRIQNLTQYDLEFYELSMIADDPKKLEQLQNSFFDDDFDDYLEEFEQEQQTKKSEQDDKLRQSERLELSDDETIRWANKNDSTRQESSSGRYEEDYEESLPTDDISDWEEV